MVARRRASLRDRERVWSEWPREEQDQALATRDRVTRTTGDRDKNTFELRKKTAEAQEQNKRPETVTQTTAGGRKKH